MAIHIALINTAKGVTACYKILATAIASYLIVKAVKEHGRENTGNIGNPSSGGERVINSDNSLEDPNPSKNKEGRVLPRMQRKNP